MRRGEAEWNQSLVVMRPELLRVELHIQSVPAIPTQRLPVPGTNPPILESAKRD
jgi:hypothetical protein